MAEEKKDPIVQTACLAPVPQPKRGYGYSISSFSGDDGDFICYTNDTNVILRNLADPDQAIVFGDHKGKVNCGAFSNNGEFVASADEDGVLLIWGRTSKVVKYQYSCVKGAYDIQWSTDDTRILVVGIGTGTENACLLNLSDGKPAAVVTGHSKAVLSASFGADSASVISCSEDMTLRFRSGEELGTATSNKKVHKAYINCVKFSPNKEFAVSVASDKKIVIWAADFTVVKEIKDAHKGSIYSVSWSPCNKYLLTASADKSAKIWDVESGKCTKTFSWQSDINNMQMGALWHGGKDQQFLVTIAFDGTINFLDQESGEYKSVKGISLTPSAFAFDQANKNFYVGDVKGGLIAHSNDEGWQKISGKGGKNKIKSLAVNCNSELVWALTNNNKLYTVECKEMKYTATITMPGGVTTLAPSKTDPTMVAVGMANKKVIIVKDGAIASESSVKFVPWVLEFSPDDSTLAIAAKQRKKLVTYAFDGNSLIGDPTELYSKLDGQPTKIQFAAREDLDAHYISCSTMRGQILIFQDGKLKNRSKWAYHSGAVTWHAWSPNGKFVSSVSQDQNLKVWHDTNKFYKDHNTMDLVHLKGGLFTEWIDDTNVISVGSSGAVKKWQVNVIPK